MIGSLVAASLMACPVQKARYAMHGDPDITAEFHPIRKTRDWPNGIALAIHVRPTLHTYWWLPWNGGTDDGRHVRLTLLRDDPMSLPGNAHIGADMDFWSTNAAYDFADRVPQLGYPAPYHFVLPHFGRAAYYWTMAAGHPDDVPRAFFDLRGCGTNAPADVVLPGIA